MVRTQLAVIVGAVVVAGCWNVEPTSGTIPVAHHAAIAGSSSWVGRYACTIDDYPPFACEIHRAARDDDRLVLDKLGGSQRIRGTIAPLTGRIGFSFVGEYYCPWGECTHPIHGEFLDTGDGRLRGQFRDEPAVVILSRDTSALAAASFGGAAYGGAAYGGAAYGGPPAP